MTSTHVRHSQEFNGGGSVNRCDRDFLARNRAWHVSVFIILGIGLIGSLNGGEVDLPLIEARADGVPARPDLVAALVGLVVFAPGIAYVCSQLQPHPVDPGRR